MDTLGQICLLSTPNPGDGNALNRLPCIPAYAMDVHQDSNETVYCVPCMLRQVNRRWTMQRKESIFADGFDWDDDVELSSRTETSMCTETTILGA